ncbi:helix-turn-helix domain-containing protein [Clostridium sp. AM48-13]
MSITKAANELHITQQCASDHIKRLEKSIMSCCLSGVPNSV